MLKALMAGSFTMWNFHGRSRMFVCRTMRWPTWLMYSSACRSFTRSISRAISASSCRPSSHSSSSEIMLALPMPSVAQPAITETRKVARIMGMTTAMYRILIISPAWLLKSGHSPWRVGRTKRRLKWVRLPCRKGEVWRPRRPLPEGYIAGLKQSGCTKRGIHHSPRFLLNATKMIRSAEALRVDLVDLLRPGRPGGEPPIFGHDLQSPDGGVVRRSPGQNGLDGLACERLRPHISRSEVFGVLLLFTCGRRIDALVDGAAELLLESGIVLGGIPPGHRHDLRRQQVEEDTVLVRRPDRAVAPQKRRPGALLPAKPVRTAQQTLHKPLETDRDLRPRPPDLRRHTVDHRARDQRLPHGRIRRPSIPVLEQIPDGHRQVVIWIHQPPSAGHEPMAVEIRSIPESDVEPVPQLDEPGHRIRR